MRAAVILAHGLWMGGWAMQGLRLLLSRRGYVAHAFDYRSMVHGLDEHARLLAARIAELQQPAIHLVGHSLGGLVILRYLRTYGEQRVGRIVLLGTPVRACIAGQRLESMAAAKRLLGASRGIWRSLPDDYRPRCELGVIAGSRPWGLGRLVLRLPGTNDGVVRLEETEVAGMRDRIVLPVSHSGMLVSARVAREVAVFLERGAFDHDGRGTFEHERRGALEHEGRGAGARPVLMRARCLLLAVALAPLVCGCGTLRYYSQAVSGHLDLMRRASPIEEQLARDAVPAVLKAKLQAVLRIREFGSRALGLPDNGSYKRYADLGRRYALWNVFAAPEFSLEPVNSCFVFVGCVSYRGYFSEADAQAEGAARRAQGYDVYVGGVPAYSTLGWFDDPVLSTFIQYPEAELARLIFHELAHQLLYVRNDTRFNESFAATVEEAGVERWLAENGNDRYRAAYEHSQRMRQEFVALVLKYRTMLKQYYRQDLPAEEKRVGKAQRFAEMEAEYRKLKASWGGFAGYDRWFSGKPNNATLASVALYTELVPAFQALLGRMGGDLPRFYAAAKELAELPKEERAAKLAPLVP